MALSSLDPAPRHPACRVEYGAQKEGSGSTLVKAAEAMFTPMAGLPFWAAILSFAVPDLRCVAHLYCLPACMLSVLHVATTVQVKLVPYRTKGCVPPYCLQACVVPPGPAAEPKND